jgi:uncharacterized damage-inducible protein DinB
MKLKALLVACCVLLSAGSILAQSGGSALDPISGTWTGVMGPSGGTLNPVTMELRYDGKAISGTITGPTLSPGVIKIGTFDPKTGAFKFDVTVKDDANSVAFLEGTIVQGTATGRVNIGNNTGSFKITKSAGDAGAQTSGGTDTAAALRTGFDEVSGWVTRAAELVPADKYTYRPAPTVRTFGQLIAHVADAHNYYCARAAGRNVQWSDATEKGSTDKATLAQKLKQSIDACHAVYGTSQVPPLMANVAHTSLHYGNIITYMRMLGLVPPSS